MGSSLNADFRQTLSIPDAGAVLSGALRFCRFYLKNS